jgi:hypothetical protein
LFLYFYKGVYLALKRFMKNARMACCIGGAYRRGIGFVEAELVNRVVMSDNFLGGSPFSSIIPACR